MTTITRSPAKPSLFGGQVVLTGTRTRRNAMAASRPLGPSNMRTSTGPRPWRGRLTLSAVVAAAQIALPGLAGADEAVDPALKQQQDQLALTKADLENQKLAIDNAEAARALTEAKHKATVDAFPKGDTTGKVDAKDGAGQVEASALAAVATAATAIDIAQETLAGAKASAKFPASLYGEVLCPELKTLEATTPSQEVAPVLLISSVDTFGFGHWDEFRFRACGTAKAFREAIAAARSLPEPKAAKKPKKAEGGGGPAGLAVGEALSIGVQLAQLITPDWEVGRVAVTSSDRALMMAVARAYRQIDGNQGRIYWASQVSRLGGSNDVFGALAALDAFDREAAKLVEKYGPGLKAAQAAYDKVAKDENATPEKLKAAKLELDVWRPVTALTEDRAAYEKLLKDLNGKEGEAVLPVSLVVQESASAKLLGPSGLALSLSLQTSGGGYYTRRVIWNAFLPGQVPYFVSGGVVVNYAAVRAADQQVYAAGLFACTASYTKLNRIAAKTNSGGAPAALQCSQSAPVKLANKERAR
ncbi:MAG: hypothetical protein ABI655_04170 [Phenylobacterium sp.]